MDTQLFTAEPRQKPSADEGARRLRVSFYDRETSTLPRLVEGTWADVVETLSTHRRADCISSTCAGRECPHKRGHAYSPAELLPGMTRAAAHVARLHFASYDIDHSSTEEIKALVLRLKTAGLECVISSTHNHRPGAPRVRLVINLSRPVLLGEWPSFWAAARKQLEVPADESAKDPARLFFEPSTPSDVAPFVWVNDGDPLDVDQVLRSVPPPAPVSRRQPLKGTEWSALLRGLDTGNRNQGLVRLAGFLMHKLDAEGALAADLIRTINQEWCKPPLEAREVETLIESVARRELAQRGAL